MTYNIDDIESGTVGMLEWRARDIGYGVEEDYGEYIARGLFDSSGNYMFEGLDRETIYLFPDEILSWERT